MENLVRGKGDFLCPNSGECRALTPDGSLSVVHTAVGNGWSVFLTRFFCSVNKKMIIVN